MADAPATPSSPVPAPSDDDALEVSALLVCREVQNGRTGASLREVLDIVPVLQFPGEAGPLAFVAFLRPTRAGEAQLQFRIHPWGDPATTVVQLPGRLNVQKGYEGRQTVVSAAFKTLTVKGGGWFGVEFRVGGQVRARTRFAIGAVGTKKLPTPGLSAGPGPAGAPPAAGSA